MTTRRKPAVPAPIVQTAPTIQFPVADTKPESRPQRQPREFWIIAYLVIASFLAIMMAILIGCGMLLSGHVSIESASALAAVSGLVGAIAGYAASNVQTVLSTVFAGAMPNDHLPRTVNDASTTINGNVEPKE